MSYNKPQLRFYYGNKNALHMSTYLGLDTCQIK
jgi:hypothetical protein